MSFGIANQFKKSFKNLKITLVGVAFVGAAIIGQAEDHPGIHEITLRLTSYNVENMFDAVHDADPALPDGKEDWTFLPLSSPLKSHCSESTGFYRRECEQTDWTPQKADWKTSNAAKVISYLPKKPDILTLAEVENANVVGDLAKKIGYPKTFLITNSPDHRGINVAIIYNPDAVKLVGTKEIPVEGDALVKATRNILRAEFQPKDSSGTVQGAHSLFVYANHWPSQAAPSSVRMFVAKTLQTDITALRTERNDDNLFVVAMGDFNTVDGDNPHPFNDLFTNPSKWDEPASAMIDLEKWARATVPALNASLLPASYWYSGEKNWNHLDHIFASQNLVAHGHPSLKASTFSILKDDRVMMPFTPNAGAFEGQAIKIPKRFDTSATTQETMGFSDHLPIGIDVGLPVN